MSEIIKEAALAYARRGWAVFPLKERGKDPLTVHGFKDASTDPGQIERWWRRWPGANVGIATGAASGGLVVIDLDEKPDLGVDGMAALVEWERANGELPETSTSLTGGGGTHLLFKSDYEVKNSVNRDLGVDVRADGGYIVAPPSVHPSGGRYEWEADPDETPPAALSAHVAAFIDHVRPSAANAGGLAGEGGRIADGSRNDTIYRYGCGLRSRGLGGDELMALLEAFNETAFEHPLPVDEVRKVHGSCMTKPTGLSDEAKALQEQAAAKTVLPTAEKPPSGHVAIAEAVMERHGACFVDGAPAIRKGGVYETGWGAINSAMVEVKRSIKSAQRREVREYLTIAAPRLTQSRYTLVGFANGVLDLESMEFRDYGPDDVICNVIPHRWEQELVYSDEPERKAVRDEVDRLLDRVSCGDEANRANILEMLGLCIMRTARFGVCPVLIGDGANGKSTVLAMLRELLGPDNISALQPREVNARFQAVRLVGKTANIGDDISSDFLTADECSGIKKVATGDLIYSDVKGAEGLEFAPYATTVFSANEFPRLGDSTPGMYRRLHPIEFNARFTRDDPEFDPNIIDKVTSEPALEYLCALAVLGASSVISNRGMTPNAASERILDAIREENNTVLMWLRMANIKADTVVDRVTTDVYGEYREWCFVNGVKQLGVKKFNKAIRTLLGVRPGSPGHTRRHGRRVSVRYYERVAS